MSLSDPKSLLMVTNIISNSYGPINLVSLLVINPDSTKFMADL